MSEEQKEEIKLFSEGRGRYNIVEGSKIYHFDFPISNTVNDNFKIVSFLSNEINKHLERVKEETKPSEKIIQLAEEDFNKNTSEIEVK